MKQKKKSYWFLMILTILFTLAGIITTIPAESASKECLLGYKAHCSFTPIGTIICFLLAGLVCIIRKRKFTR
jgi:hypothetical protein